MTKKGVNVYRHQLPARMLVCIDEYMKGVPKNQAMLKAGYKLGSTKRVGLVFNREDVKDEIEKRQTAARVHYKVDQDWIIQRLAAIADAPRAAERASWRPASAVWPTWWIRTT